MSFSSVLKGFFAVGVLGVAAQGCIVVGGGGSSLPAYSRGCVSSIDCAGAQLCQSANTITTGGGGGRFCTLSCSTGSACPASPNGLPVVCVQTSSGGQCYEGCGAGNSCVAGYTAVMDSLGTCFCTPN